MNEDVELIDYQEAMKRLGMRRRTFNARLQEHRDSIRLYQHGRDRRVRLIDARDAERLAEIRPIRRREPQDVA